MIAQLSGTFLQKQPSSIIIDVNGVGYEVQISLNTYSAIAQKDSGTLLTYLHITENAQTLFGFADKAEKEMFLMLISVNGVGASTARMMLSGMQPNEIAHAITIGNTQQLEKIKGIGKKTAERLVVELRDKVGKKWMAADASVVLPGISTNHDAVEALVALGIAKPMADKAVQKVLKDNQNISIENIIKLALKNL